MHVLIGLISVIVTLLYVLERFGVDIGWINPWAWKRKRAWQKQYHANPAFSLDKPLESLALLLTATAKIDGDLSSDEKNELLRIFEEDLHQSSTDASGLLGSSTFLLGSGREVFDKPGDVLLPSLGKFSDAQKKSSIELLKKVAQVGGRSSDTQDAFIAKIVTTMTPEETSDSWS